MICPRCQSPIVDGPQQILGRNGRTRARVLACGRCRAAFSAHQAASSQRDRIYAEHGAWFRVA
jgi:hypothetical protein